MNQPYDGQQSPAPIPHSPTSAYGSPSPYTSPSAPSTAGTSSRGEAGFFRAMFDFSFQHFITVKFSSFIYVLAFVVAAVYWGLQVLVAILMGLALASDPWTGEQGFNVFPLVLAILFGWIPSVILLIAMRLGLEFAVATIRTAQNTKRLVEVAEAGR